MAKQKHGEDIAFKMYKAILQLYSKKTNNPINKSAKDLSNFQKNICATNK